MLRIAKLVILCGPRILWSYFSWMIKYSKNPKKYPLDLRYKKSRNLILFVFKKMSIDLKIENYEILKNLPKKTLIIANHQSIIDIVMLISISPQPITFIAKAETKKMPFVNRILRGLEGEFLERDNPRQSIEVLRDASEKIKNNYCHVCVYPEGHRNKDPFGELLDFHGGSFKPAYWNEAPILYFAEHGTFRVLDIHLHYKKYPIFVKFNEPVQYSEYSAKTSNEYAVELKNKVYSEVLNLVNLDKQYFANKNHLTKKASGENFIDQLN